MNTGTLTRTIGILLVIVLMASIGGLVRLTNAGGSDKIVFVSYRDGGRSEIYSMNVDGSNPIRLTNNNADDTMPSWSPDGSHLLWISYLFNSEWCIY